MRARINALARRCRTRGGDCPCVRGCDAVRQIETELIAVRAEESNIRKSREWLESTKRRIETPPATLAEGFVFDKRYEPVMVFDGNEGTFGYEDQDGEWIDCDEWPFQQNFIWPDDCERHGIRVE